MAKTIDSRIQPQIEAKTPQQRTLEEKEAEQVRLRQGRALSPSDAARLASRAGFQRMGAKSRKGFDVGDSSQAPIPIPDDEADTEVWTPERLKSAQENLTLAAAQFAEITKVDTKIDPGPFAQLAETVVGSSFLPTEEGVQALETLANKNPVPVLMLEEVTTNVKRFFDIPLTKDTPPGHAMLAAGLVVAGEKMKVKVGENGQNGLDERELADGLKNVAQKSNHAVGQAQRLGEGINTKVNIQRTFIKR